MQPWKLPARRKRTGAGLLKVEHLLEGVGTVRIGTNAQEGSSAGASVGGPRRGSVGRGCILESCHICSTRKRRMIKKFVT